MCGVTAHRLPICEELRIQQHVHISLEGGSLHAMHSDREPARAIWFDAQYVEVAGAVLHSVCMQSEGGYFDNRCGGRELTRE